MQTAELSAAVPARAPRVQREKITSAQRWAEWLKKLAADSDLLLMSNRARATNLYREGLIRGLRDLRGDIPPNSNTILFKDESRCLIERSDLDLIRNAPRAPRIRP
jgi:hypothetical protein